MRRILRTVCVAEQRNVRISSTVVKPSGTRLPRCLRNCVNTDALSCNLKNQFIYLFCIRKYFIEITF